MSSLPRDLFRRLDESPGEVFYRKRRRVTHLDDATIAALTQIYRELVPAGASVLDLGLGMHRVQPAAHDHFRPRQCAEIRSRPPL